MTDRHIGSTTKGTRRWLRAGALAVAALVAAVSAPGLAGAQDARPAWVNGDAKASANLFDFKIQISGAIGADSGLGIGFGAGRALTQYQDTAASSEGRAIDYSLVELLNDQPTPECPDLIPIYLASTEPPVTLAESSNPASAASQVTTVRYAGFPTHGPEFGTQDATAGPGIAAHANTNAKLVDAGIVKMVNPKSESTSRLVNGVREAVAVSSADSLSIMGGAMTLFRPVWKATARSGATTETTAEFSYSSAQILGITRPGGRNEDLNAFKGFVESTFSALGLRLYLPKVTTTPGPNGTGSVSISPLLIGMENIPLGSNVLAPLLRMISPQIDEAVAAYLAQECSKPGMQLLADVARGIASGKGGLSFSVGGADAMTDDIYYPPANFDLGGEPPLDPSLSPSLPIDSGLGASVLDSSLSSGGLGLDSSLPLTTDTLPLDTTDTTVADDTDERADAPEVASVQQASERSTPGTTGGTAGWVTLVGVLAVVALAGADQFVMRRSRRKFA